MSTVPELIDDLIYNGLIAAQRRRDFELALREASFNLGIRVAEMGSKFVPELGGVVRTLVPRELSEAEGDALLEAVRVSDYA